MTLPPLNSFYVITAAFPLLIVLYLMIGRSWGGSKAGPVGWFAAILVSIVIFGGNGKLLLVATGRSLLLAFFVLYIIWMAILLYHIVNEAGAISVIGQGLPGLAGDKPGQALLLGWVFGSFLQGASGFGVPAAVVAPLLVGLGFAPNPAVVIALVGHAWAVTFGSLGSSFYSLIASTDVAGTNFAQSSAIMLGVASLLCGLAVLWETGKGIAIRRRFGQLLAVGLAMALSQFTLASMGLYSLAAFGAGIVGLVVIVLDFRFGLSDLSWWKRWRHKHKSDFQSSRIGQYTSKNADFAAVDYKQSNEEGASSKLLKSRLLKAIVPYLILTTIIIAGQLVWKDQLDFIIIDPNFPSVSTAFGWQTMAGPGRAINVMGHAGALLLYTSLISYFWFRWRGPFSGASDYNARVIARKTIKGSARSTVGVISLVAMAVTMQHSGMTQLLAQALSHGTGLFFPFISPFIGALGAFMTGSNTNSNVVFGSLQLETALALGLSIPLILAAQTAGGAIGSLFAPAKVIVGCSTVSGAQDGQVLKKATLYGLLIVLLLGIFALAVSLIFS